MSIDEQVRSVQRSYPSIWFRCHDEHAGRTASLSQRESTVLNHLSSVEPQTPRELATHLSIATSTLSEAMDKLVERGLATRTADSEDRRRVRYGITASGESELDSSSVLSASAVRAALEHLSEEQRTRAVEGLERLASACSGSGS